jgi:hypothetical protein
LNVWESFELADRQMGLHGSVVAPGAQHEAVLKQTFLRHLIEPPLADTVRYAEQVDFVAADALLKGVAWRLEVNGHRRSTSGKLGEQLSQNNCGCVIAGDDCEPSFIDGRIEVRSLGDQLLDQTQCVVQLFLDRFGVGRKNQLATMAHQQGIAERLSKTGPPGLAGGLYELDEALVGVVTADRDTISIAGIAFGV